MEQDRLLPGSTGIVPTTEVLSHLASAGYDGPVTPYCHPAQFSQTTRNRAMEMAAVALRRWFDVDPAATLETESRARVAEISGTP